MLQKFVQMCNDYSQVLPYEFGQLIHDKLTYYRRNSFRHDIDQPVVHFVAGKFNTYSSEKEIY